MANFWEYLEHLREIKEIHLKARKERKLDLVSKDVFLRNSREQFSKKYPAATDIEEYFVGNDPDCGAKASFRYSIESDQKRYFQDFINPTTKLV